jgi:hypothetical protein
LAYTQKSEGQNLPGRPAFARRLRRAGPSSLNTGLSAEAQSACRR